MKIVLVNGKIFRDIDVIRQTEIVITIVPIERMGTDKEEKEETQLKPKTCLRCQEINQFSHFMRS